MVIFTISYAPPHPQDIAVGAPFLTHPQILWYAHSTESGTGDER